MVLSIHLLLLWMLIKYASQNEHTILSDWDVVIQKCWILNSLILAYFFMLEPLGFLALWRTVWGLPLNRLHFANCFLSDGETLQNAHIVKFLSSSPIHFSYQYAACFAYPSFNMSSEKDSGLLSSMAFFMWALFFQCVSSISSTKWLLLRLC